MPRRLIPLLLAVPCVAAVWWMRHRRPADGYIPPSLGERALQRLRSI